MMKIAITGNIASGKSQVEKILLEQGFIIIDSDNITHDLLKNNADCIKQIKKLFINDDILESDDTISRQKLGKIIFNSSDKKCQLENVLHKKILEEINNSFLKYKNEQYIFITLPLLFEVKWEKYFDKVIFVSAKENIRLERLIKRNSISKEDAIKRINSQLDENLKIKQSDFIIYNNSDLNTLKNQVINLINLHFRRG